MAIHFHLDYSKIELSKRKIIKSWLENAIDEEGYIQGRISIILTNDQKLLELNREFMSRDVLTDIIAFDYSEKGKVDGDLFISVERVKENAVNYKVSFTEELMRVIIHGLLHLMGYNDKKKAGKRKMSAKEDHYLKKVLPDLS